MRNKIYITLILTLFAVFRAMAFDASQAEEAYDTGNYELACALYSDALATEGVSAGLLYNLGNCYFQMGKEGQAMLCYERARRLDPGNEMIRSNLEFLSNRIIDANKGELQGKPGNLEPDNESFSEKVYRLIAIDRSSNSWAVFAVMAFILFMGALALYTFTPNILARKTGFFSGIVFLAFTAAFITFSYLAARQAESQDQAIITAFTTELLEHPEENARKATTPLHEGTKLKVLEVKKGDDGTEWLKVKLNSANSGWIKKQDLEII